MSTAIDTRRPSEIDPNWRRRPKVWTAPKRWQLMEYLERGYNDRQIAARFNTSPDAIKLARRRHGIRPASQQFYTARRVANLLGIPCSKTVSRWIEQGWLRAKRSFLRAGGRRHWMIKHHDLVAFLENEEHWHRWEPEHVDRMFSQQAERRAQVRFLTTGEVAERLYVTSNAVQSWIQQERLPAVRHGNWLIREDDLDGFVQPIHRDFRKGQRRRRYSVDEDKRLRELRAAGMTFAEIGARLGRSTSSVSNRQYFLDGRRSS